MMEDASWMMTLDEFESKTMKAFELQPQKGSYAFLPGKGWGTEIAIQYPVYQKTADGYVERKKNPACFRARGYRSHSDFEMYGMQPGGPDSHYTPEFYQEFGAPEYFETTKNDEGVSRDELWNNTEVTVLPNGQKVTTLSVEYLVAEKLIEHPEFEHPNNHGRDISDAGALALVYDDIDREKVKEIYVKNFINHHVKRLEQEREQPDEKLLGGAKNAEAFITAPRPGIGGRSRPSRYEDMIQKMERHSDPVDSLVVFAPFHNVGLLRQEDYAPLMAINNDPKSWVDGKLTEEAKQAVKEAMIKSTQAHVDNRGPDIQKRIENMKRCVENIDLFFSAVDRKRKEIEQQEAKGREENPPKESTQESHTDGLLTRAFARSAKGTTAEERSAREGKAKGLLGVLRKRDEKAPNETVKNYQRRNGGR